MFSRDLNKLGNNIPSEQDLTFEEFMAFSPEQNTDSFTGHLARYNYALRYVKDKIVLDAGCAYGFGATLLAQKAKRVIGIDLNKHLIEHANNTYGTHNLEFKVMDCTQMQFSDDMFDIVCSFEVIEHIKDVRLYLAEVRRVLRADGLFILSTPNRLIRDLNLQDVYIFHHKEYYLDELYQLLEEYFSQVEIFGLESKQLKQIYDKIEKNWVWKILRNLDVVNIRRFIPRDIKSKIQGVLVGTPPNQVDMETFEVIKEDLAQLQHFIAKCKQANA